MTTIVLSVTKADVYKEVAKTCSYTGAKRITPSTEEGQPSVYERIFTTDADAEMLDRYWAEGCNEMTSMFKPFIGVCDGDDISYTVSLMMGNSFSTSLTSTVNSNLFSYLVYSICAKWFLMTSPEDVQKYELLAEEAKNKVREDLYFKKKPVRTVIN